MNYRHIYHAGNFADVFKHWILTLILEHLNKKDKPYAVLDTHAEQRLKLLIKKLQLIQLLTKLNIKVHLSTYLDVSLHYY